MRELSELSKEELIAIVEHQQKLVNRDSLTGLYSANFFNRIFDEEILRSARYGYEFCVLVMDVDRFKQFNDANGHVAGSKLLSSFGKFLEENCRIVDLAFRYGGDEFVLLLPQTSKANGCVVAQAINRFLKRHEWETDSPAHTISVSVGVSSYPSDSDATDLFAIADRAMYVAKAAGGGRAAAAGLGLLAEDACSQNIENVRQKISL